MIKILVPVNGSECALDAVRHAAFLYRESGVAEVVLLNVQPPLEHSRASAFHSLAALREQESQDGECALEQASNILDDSGVRYTAMIGVGSPAQAVASAATALNCDGIVIGVNLWSRIKACFGAGLASGIMRKTSVPVTVVKSAGASGALTSQPLPPVLPASHRHARPTLVVYP
ncbi:universal stress protein UspA [Cupriavidus sp. HMR-1]|uniref:universal stress protein n=1 Tax=Cupriavidus sp. HMR-1 TaxID=1249621 RepID=UPI0002A45B4B|nr:universal stress protein [Cupriavidus sp. HMR-1]ELA01106.1 universal stress protein UspA [Cupriavidus sp. HMR-1]